MITRSGSADIDVLLRFPARSGTQASAADTERATHNAKESIVWCQKCWCVGDAIMGNQEIKAHTA